jgi:hypothetical protein
MTDDELIGFFEACTVPPGGFGHAEHVRVAWCYLNRHAPDLALDAFRAGLRRFAEAQGKPERYHETITTAYLLLIQARRLREPGLSWEAFAARHPDLLCWRPSILDRCYRPETLQSDEARRTFVPPDVTGAEMAILAALGTVR